MKVASKFSGIMDVDEKQKVTFPQGLFGFEDYREFVILDAATPPFFWLQSLDHQDIAFPLIEPFLFRPDYELDISDDELAEIAVSTPKKQAVVFTIVTIPKDGSPITANLQGPLVINKETRLGRQVILSDPRWKTKHDIVSEMNDSKRNRKC